LALDQAPFKEIAVQVAHLGPHPWMSTPLLDLSTVTLLCVETRDPALAHFAIQKCTQQARFGKVVLITELSKLSNQESDSEEGQVGNAVDQKVDQAIDRLRDVEYVQAPPIKSTKDYSDLLLTGLRQYVSGTHVLIIQWDSFILHPELWTNDFLRYDYIGAVWPHHPDTPVGNGGFSLRSVKLLEALESPKITRRHPEDFCICVDNKAVLENEFGIRFAPKDVAEQFAVERSDWHPAFGFHGFFNFSKALGDAELEHFLDMLPSDYLGGVDTYDLIDSLQLDEKNLLAKKIINRLQFRWKMRKKYIRAKLGLTLR
jgi:hypothetical protein